MLARGFNPGNGDDKTPADPDLHFSTILGIPVDSLSEVEAARWIDHVLTQSDRCRHIATYNPEYAMAARRDRVFKAALLDADLITADGIGITIAARLHRNALRITRLTGVDLMRLLAEASARNQAPIFLLGADPDVAPQAAAHLQEIAPGARFAGWWWEGTPLPADDAGAIARIEASGARTVAVAYGAPGQLLWIERNRAALTDAGVSIAIGVGGAFDYWAGTAKLAPPIVRRFGFEWLYRLIREPWRWRRQLALPVFALLAGIEAVKSWLSR